MNRYAANRYRVIREYNSHLRKVNRKQMRYADVFYLVMVGLIGWGVYSKISDYLDYAIKPIDVNAVEGFISPLPRLNTPITPVPTFAPSTFEYELKEPVLAVSVIQDRRAERLEEYLISKQSPLAPYAGLLVAEADKHDIGWTKSVSISSIESQFGKLIKPGSHNAWGIMAFSGGKRTGIRMFNSWEEAIKYHAALLGNNYKVNEYDAIQEKYCPSFECNPKWVDHVVLASDQILEKK